MTPATHVLIDYLLTTGLARHDAPPVDPWAAFARANPVTYQFVLAAWDAEVAAGEYSSMMLGVLQVHRRGLVLVGECGMNPLQVRTVVRSAHRTGLTYLVAGSLRPPKIIGRAAIAARVEVYPPWPDRPLPPLPAGWVGVGATIQYEAPLDQEPRST